MIDLVLQHETQEARETGDHSKKSPVFAGSRFPHAHTQKKEPYFSRTKPEKS